MGASFTFVAIRIFNLMYSKAEVSQLKQEFWTIFGQYMSPLRSADGEKINWVNYKTGIRQIRFTMQAEKNSAMIAVIITANDTLTRELYFDQFIQLKHLLKNELGEDWLWQSETIDEFGKNISTISTELTEASIYKKEDWPQLISFFKPRIIALDAFWSNVKYGFENL